MLFVWVLCFGLSALCCSIFSFFFFFNDTATTEIYTLSLHDALPISETAAGGRAPALWNHALHGDRSEEHTSELQSHSDLVCRLLLEKKKKKPKNKKTKHTKKTPKTKKKKHNQK